MKPYRGLLVGVVIVLLMGMFFIVGSGTAYLQNSLSIFLPFILNNFPKPIVFTPTPTTTVSPEITPTPNGIMIFVAGPIQGELNMEDIYKIKTDGTELVNLTNDLAGYSDLVWSPDGSRFAFYRQKEVEIEPQGIYTMNADGSSLTYLAYGEEPSWSPDGSLIVFVEWDRYEDYTRLSVINADGSGLRKLAGEGDYDYIFDPEWSPKGDKIAFCWDDGYNPRGIFVINTDGTNIINLTNGLTVEDPRWSPDGSQILFSESGDIYVMNADGTERSNLTNSPLIDERFHFWSPDGSKIAYVCQAQICVMNPDGSGAINVSGEHSAYFWPSWSPDGSKLAFMEGSYASNYNIFSVNSDGSGKTLLTDLPSETWKDWLAWQP